MSELDYRSEVFDLPEVPRRSRLPTFLFFGAGMLLVVLLAVARWRSASLMDPRVGQSGPTVHFEVRLAETAAGPGLSPAQLTSDPTGRVVYMHPESVVSNRHVETARVITDPQDRPAIEITLTYGGAERMRRATSRHSGRPLAFQIDGRVVIAPTVNAQIGGTGVIQGGFTQAQAERIARGIVFQ